MVWYVSARIQQSPDIRRKFKEMIEKLEERPHLYYPFHREDSTNTHVHRWLLSTSGKAEPEHVGFTSTCPWETNRRLASIQSRVSQSDIDICSRKRKRNDDDHDDYDTTSVSVGRSSSESRLVYGDDVTSRVPKKRTRLWTILLLF